MVINLPTIKSKIQPTKSEFKVAKGKIVNCFYDGSDSGFGDFLRGSIHLYDLCKKHKLDFDVDLSYHPICKYFDLDSRFRYSKGDINCITQQTKEKYGFAYYKYYMREVFQTLSSTKDNEIKYIFSIFNWSCNIKPKHLIDHNNHNQKLTEDCSTFFRERLKFSDIIKNSVESELRDKNIKSFDLLHFRLGDNISFLNKNNDITQTPPNNEKCFQICLDKYTSNSLPIVVISDSNELKKFIKNQAQELKLPFYVFHLESGHMQKRPSSLEDEDGDFLYTEDNLFYAVFDMKLISTARSAESFSVYPWGSGFLSWMAQIYNVPITLNKFK